MSIGGTLPPTRTIAAARRFPAAPRSGGRDRGSVGDDAPGMPNATSKKHVAVIDQMAAEWSSMGRSRPAVRSLRAVAGRDRGLAVLVLGTDDDPPPCPTPCDLVEH